MRAFHIHLAQPESIVICQATEDMGLARISPFANELSLAVTSARQHGTLRMIWDALSGHVISAEAREIVSTIIGRDASDENRVAILVPDSSDPRARLSASGNSHLFKEEIAALEWLQYDAATCNHPYTRLSTD